MTLFSYRDSPYPVRDDIKQAHGKFWQRLAAPGSWWTGEDRIAIAQEVRNATACRFCTERKQALSPYSLDGRHDSDTNMAENVIDAVHRIITDQFRITEAWVDQLASEGVSNEAYVELVGIADSTGIPVDDMESEIGKAIREELNLNRFPSSSDTLQQQQVLVADRKT